MPAPVTDPYKLVGMRVADKYTIEAVIDRGGYGLVYRAFHEILGVPVALKFYTGLAQAPVDKQNELLDRFAQEGGLLSSLSTRSASIVQARDIGKLVDRGRGDDAVSWCSSGSRESLEKILLHKESPARGKTRETGMRAFELLDGVARALAIAHAGGVAHRDIKPGNFFALGQDLQPGVVVKLLDFGIAKVMPSDLSLTGRRPAATSRRSTARRSSSTASTARPGRGRTSSASRW
jgi:serine/threonine protein kinase